MNIEIFSLFNGLATPSAIVLYYYYLSRSWNSRYYTTPYTVMSSRRF